MFIKSSYLFNPPFFIFLWLILIFLLFFKFSTEPSFILFGISTVLIFTHVLFGLYFLLKKEKQIDIFIFFISSLIYILLIFLIKTISHPFFWFIYLGVIFLCAIAFHAYYKRKLTQVYLQEFCNYKIYIEIYGAVLSLTGILMYFLLPAHKVILGALSLIYIIRLNFLILKKKKLYSISYQPPVIPETPFVSIVIISYNEEHYIGKLLESIRGQDYSRYEVILVDDYSTDRTKEIAEKFEPFLPLKIMQKHERGTAHSRNYGASFAKGEVILFLDADVVLPANSITDNIKVFREKQLSIAFVDFLAITDNKIDRFIARFYRNWLKLTQYYNPRGIGFCLFVYRQLHKKILFDKTVIMSEDFDYVKRAAEHGKFRIIDNVPIKVSWRRFQKENRLLLILKYLFFECYRQNIGEIRKKMLPYEFGHSDSLTK